MSKFVMSFFEATTESHYGHILGEVNPLKFVPLALSRRLVILCRICFCDGHKNLTYSIYLAPDDKFI